MRIAFDHQIFGRQSWGGISRYFARLAEELHAGGDDVSVMAHFHKNHHLDAVWPALVNGRSVTAWPKRIGKIAQQLNAPLLSLSLNQWAPDIFHETYYKGRHRNYLKAPVVVTVYDMIHEIMPTAFRRDDKTPERKRQAVLRADHVICISENTRRDLLNLVNVDPGKTSVVHLGVDLPGASATATTGHKESNQHEPQKRPFALYVGNRSGYKNFRILLQAIGNSRTLRDNLDIVCFGGGAFSSEEITLASKLGIQASQLIHDSGDDRKLENLYRHASVFVHTSLYEGFGLPPLEAMAQGCPVISSNASCMPEVLGDAAHYFDPSSIEDLRSALHAVVDDQGRRAALIVAGKEHCKSLSWQQCAQNTRRAYESVLS